ncbi:MAG: hypothetical protein RL069_2676, partial [Planctomycetota bacterium]
TEAQSSQSIADELRSEFNEITPFPSVPLCLCVSIFPGPKDQL